MRPTRISAVFDLNRNMLHNKCGDCFESIVGISELLRELGWVQVSEGINPKRDIVLLHLLSCCDIIL